ncbi:MAG: PKD domain-containing protein, partial [Bacteroidales bacterium]|nr:PKD domain-containing protein [Bacteroidales bacterium]
DHSNAPGADIAGYFWESTGTPSTTSSTPNFILVNYANGDKVTHRVYNNCGCYDEEVFLIEVIEGAPLKLDCYGTACEGDTVTYHASALSCTEYHWYVDGGTLVGGQGTATPTVQWDRPHDGYGILGLDGSFCDEVCPTLMSRKIPVIHSGLTIQGETDVCVGDAVLYRLPLFGSTRYDWEITPLNGVDDAMVTHGNEARMIFQQAGTYEIRVSYRCEFLDCGPHEAEPLTVTVKPKFAITGDEQVCLGNACTLYTQPAVAATWHAIALDNGNQPVGNAVTGTTYTPTLTAAGRYLVTAEHPDYCGPATFVLTVKDPPLPPTVDDLSADNLHTACPYSGIALSGSPSNPNYSLVWMPACSTATPQQYAGDAVSIAYQADVCDVNVYYYDHQLNCLSATPYVHTVSALTAEPVSLPTSITVCPNTLITWGDAQVPDQSAAGMLYEWKIQDTKQYCASVQGSHLENGVTLAINEVTLPEQFTVSLTRTWCSNSSQTITINIIEPTVPTPPTISGDDAVCAGSNATYTGSGGCNTNLYHWSVDDVDYYSVSSITPTFSTTGSCTVKLTCNPHDYCQDASYLPTAIKTVTVESFPAIDIIGSNVLSINPPQSNCTYVWRYKPLEGGNFTEVGTTSTLNSLGNGIYECTITNTITGCTETLLHTISPGSMNVCDELIVTHGNFDYCTRTIRVMATNPTYNLSWTVTNNVASVTTSGTHNGNADITVNNVGYYSVIAYGTNNSETHCERGKTNFMVDFLPNFTVSSRCDQLIIDNHSLYLDGNAMVYLSIKNLCNNQIATVSFPASQTQYIYTVPATYSSIVCNYEVDLTQVGSISITPPCTLGSITARRALRTVDVTTDNTIHQGQSCNNTPIGLTATLNGNTVRSSQWNFGDGSTYKANGGHVSHTFAYPGQSPYTVTVIVTNVRGCTYTSPAFTITSNPTPFTNNALLQPSPLLVCPGSDNDVTFYPNYIPNTFYRWCEIGGTPVSDGNPHAVQYPDYYYALATNNNYCKKEATRYVGFLNPPTARIRTEQTKCCVGETVTLDGTVHTSAGNVIYSWTVIDPSNAVLLTAATPSISFVAEDAGTYTITLNVLSDPNSGGNGCSATATQIITANPKPAPPTLAFGSNQCLHLGPVDLTATGYTGTLHWSNGTTGSPTQYNTYGRAVAYYYDPTIGCPSDTVSILVERQPDFDALLTGCYKKCKGSYELPVYGLTNTTQQIGWRWWQDNTLLTSGSGVYYGTPLVLPVGFGNHQLEVSYQGGNCSETSSSLTVTMKDTCDCEGIAVTVAKITSTVSNDCKLTYNAVLHICNNSGGDFCFDTLKVLSVDANVQVTLTDTPWAPLADGDCGDYMIKLNVSSLDPMSVLLRLTGSCPSCTKDFSVSLPVPDCEQTVKKMSFGLVDFTNVAVYFDFDMPLPTGGYLYGIYSEPPMITGYSYDASTGTLSGSGMLDAALLSQLAAAGETVCFHALLCVDGKLCKYTFCLSALELINTLDIVIRNGNNSKGSVRARSETGADLPALQPNPTTGEVRVTGAKGEVAEATVLDMHGRQVALFPGTDCFNVSSLAAGTYIVRLKVRDGDSHQTYYLKLVKK